jgi:hypothetical protein
MLEIVCEVARGLLVRLSRNIQSVLIPERITHRYWQLLYYLLSIRFPRLSTLGYKKILRFLYMVTSVQIRLIEGWSAKKVGPQGKPPDEVPARANRLVYSSYLDCELCDCSKKEEKGGGPPCISTTLNVRLCMISSRSLIESLTNNQLHSLIVTARSILLGTRSRITNNNGLLRTKHYSPQHEI